MPSGYIYTVDIHTGYMSAEYARGKQRFRLGTDTKNKKGANEQYFAFALRKQLTNDNGQENN